MAKRYKRVKNGLGTDYLRKYGEGHHNSNLMLEAMTNPDLLSTEQGMFDERDFDEEEHRRKFIYLFKLSLKTLTVRQAQIVEALQQHPNQESAASSLGIARPTLAVSLLQIQKKIFKFINNNQSLEQTIGEPDEEENSTIE